MIVEDLKQHIETAFLFNAKKFCDQLLKYDDLRKGIKDYSETGANMDYYAKVFDYLAKEIKRVQAEKVAEGENE